MSSREGTCLTRLHAEARHQLEHIHSSLQPSGKPGCTDCVALGRAHLGFLISENKGNHGGIIKPLQKGNDEGERKKKNKTLQLG